MAYSPEYLREHRENELVMWVENYIDNYLKEHYDDESKFLVPFGQEPNKILSRILHKVFMKYKNAGWSKMSFTTDYKKEKSYFVLEV